MSLFHLTVAGIGVLMVAVLHILFKPASEDKETKTHTHTATKTTKPVSKFASIHFTQCPFLTKHLFPKLVLLKSSFSRQEGKRTKRKGGERKERTTKLNLFYIWLRSECLLFGHSSGQNWRKKKSTLRSSCKVVYHQICGVQQIPEVSLWWK